MVMKLYGDAQSGNCYKVQLLLSYLQKSYDWIAIDILAGDTQTNDFLALNPNGKIPLLELENNQCLAESNAILNYLADGTPLLPSDAWDRAQVLSWQFFEQYSHEPNIAVARFINKYLGLPDERLDEYNSKQTGGHKALSVMETQLQQSNYICGDTMTIADISLYAYTHVADEGGFDLTNYPALNRWLDEVAAQPNHIPMQTHG
jgi:glutathione S-transferase